MAEEDNNEQDQKELEKERNKANNTKNIRNAADVAIASGHPIASGVGLGVKALDKVTGGKASNALGEGLTTATKIVPGGNKFQRLSNKLSESGVSDAAGTVASFKNKNSNANNNTETTTERNIIDENETLSKQTTVNRNNPTNNNYKNKTSDNKDDRFSSSLQPKENKKRGLENLSDSNPQKKDSTSTTTEEGEASGDASLKFSKKIAVVSLFLVPLLIALVIIVPIFSIYSMYGGIINRFLEAISITTDADEGYFTETGDEDLDKFLKDVTEIYNQDFVSNNIMVCKPVYVVAVFHIIYENDSEIYEHLSRNDVKEVFWASLRGDCYNEEAFREKLTNTILPQYLKGSEYDYEELTDDIFEYVDQYYQLIGNEEEEITCEVDIHTCDYTKGKGFYVSGVGSTERDINYSNLFVQLMKCNSTEILGDEDSKENLIPFEKYVLGVTYMGMMRDQKNNYSPPGEAVKAYSIMVRDYALRKYMEQDKEGKSKILRINNCDTKDSYPYCDPDLGCSLDYEGNYRSGFPWGDSRKFLDPLSAEDYIRKYVNQVNGITLMNESGYIIAPTFSNKDRNKFINLANNNTSFESILLNHYTKNGADSFAKNKCYATTTTTDCVSDGRYAEWKQKDPQWSNTPMGRSGKTLGQIGCLVTSISMQIAKSGVKTRITNLNPGSFVEFLNRNNGFDDRGNFQWNSATTAAPTFRYMGQISLSGLSQAEKLQRIRNIVSQKNNYAVVEVMGGIGQHWVAIDSISGNTINIMDSGKENSTNLWASYDWTRTSTLAYYRVG